MLKEMFRDMSNHTISNKITPPEKLRAKWNLTSMADYQLGRMLSAWQLFGIREFFAKYNRSTTDYQDIQIWHIAEESILELREYYKTLD
jgi:hypothetical protein